MTLATPGDPAVLAHPDAGDNNFGELFDDRLLEMFLWETTPSDHMRNVSSIPAACMIRARSRANSSVRWSRS